MEEIFTFVRTHDSWAYAFIGAVSAWVFSILKEYITKQRDYRLKIADKLSDKRIHAHELVIELAKDMRVMTSFGGLDENNEVRRFPRILFSRDDFNQWFTKFTSDTQRSSTWHTIKVKHELNFIQDYLVNLHMIMEEIDSRLCPEVGVIIRQDFIDMSSSLEKITFRYFEKEVYLLKVPNLSSWHKYKLNVTMQRLHNTQLLLNRDRILALSD